MVVMEPCNRRLRCYRSRFATRLAAPPSHPSAEASPSLRARCRNHYPKLSLRSFLDRGRARVCARALAPSLTHSPSFKLGKTLRPKSERASDDAGNSYFGFFVRSACPSYYDNEVGVRGRKGDTRDRHARESVKTRSELRKVTSSPAARPHFIDIGRSALSLLAIKKPAATTAPLGQKKDDILTRRRRRTFETIFEAALGIK